MSEISKEELVKELESAHRRITELEDALIYLSNTLKQCGVISLVESKPAIMMFHKAQDERTRHFQNMAEINLGPE